MRRRRNSVALALCLFTPAAALAATATINFDNYSYIRCAVPFFNRPGYTADTAAYIVAPAECWKGAVGVDHGNDSFLQNAAGLFVSPPHSTEVRWSWVDPADQNTWLRVLTSRAGGDVPWRRTPVVHLAAPGRISMDILAYGVDSSGTANPAGAIEFSLVLRETGDNLLLGAEGSTTGSVELVGCTGTGGGGATPDPNTPIGGVTLAGNASWYHVEWVIVDPAHVDVYVNDPAHANPIHKSVVALPGSGDGVLSAAHNRGILDGLAIRKPVSDTVTKQWFVDFDNIVIDAPGVTELVVLNGPLSALKSTATVTRVDPTASRVNLYGSGGGSPNLLAFATAPPAIFASGTYEFSSLNLLVGHSIAATQVVDGVEGGQSDPVAVSDCLALETGVSWERNPPANPMFRKWYEVNSTTNGSLSAGWAYGMARSTNGFYTILDHVFPAARTDYRLRANVNVVNGSGITSYEMGAVVNGVHRDVTSTATPGSNNTGCHNQSLLAVDTALPGNVIAQYPMAEPYAATLITDPFAASESDNLLIVFSTNVHTKWSEVAIDTTVSPAVLDGSDPCEGSTYSWPPAPRTPVRNAQGTWNMLPDRTPTSRYYWSFPNTRVYVKNLELTYSGATSAVSAVSLAPVADGAQVVTVREVSPGAATVQVYVNGSTLIGMAAAVSPQTTVLLTRPVACGESLSATQVVDGVEGSPAAAPIRTVCSTRIIAWRSLKTHSGYGEIAIPLNPAASATSGVTVESRNSAGQNGITRIQLDFEIPVQLLDPSNIAVRGATTTGCGVPGANCLMGPVNVYTPSSVTMSGPQTMTMAFASGTLPGDGCYVITIGPGTINGAVLGDADCKVMMLQSDVTGDALINVSDLAEIKYRSAQAITTANCRSDQNLAAGIGLADVTQTKSRFGRRAYCP